MPLTKQQQLYVSWFAFHNSEIATAKQQKWQKITSGGKTFYLAERVTEDTAGHPEVSPYKIILGYCADTRAGKLQGRFWYYSGSEASWRAFTGYRSGGAWTKGAEFETGAKRIYTHMGYVYECFVTADMHESLQLFWNQRECKNSFPDICPWKNPKADELKLTGEESPVFKYLVGSPKAKAPSGIGKIYNNERLFAPANLPTGISAKVKDLSEKKGSVDIQESYEVDAVSGRRTGIGHVFKKDTELNNWINGCLKGEQSAVQQYHPVLKDDYTVWSYNLKGNAAGANAKDDLVVEIAATNNPKDHHYKDYTDTVQTLKTPVCWIRNVYYPSSATSSFGTKASIPINLAFLVQKPCDYPEQASDYYGQKIDFKKADAVGGKYTILSMLNEATSPLIKAFKDEKHYPRFREKYHAAKVAYDKAPAALPLPADADGLGRADRADFLKRLIVMGINEYLCIQTNEINSSYSKSGHHGSAGLNRAEQLLVEIGKCTDVAKTSQVMYGCFANNRVGTFTGGIFSKIRTEPTSLFTCVCRYLLPPFAVPAPDTTAVKAPVPIHWSKLSLASGLKGNDHAIDRMAYWIHNAPVPKGVSEALHITAKAADLLTALKG